MIEDISSRFWSSRAVEETTENEEFTATEETTVIGEVATVDENPGNGHVPLLTFQVYAYPDDRGYLPQEKKKNPSPPTYLFLALFQSSKYQTTLTHRYYTRSSTRIDIHSKKKNSPRCLQGSVLHFYAPIQVASTVSK